MRIKKPTLFRVQFPPLFPETPNIFDVILSWAGKPGADKQQTPRSTCGFFIPQPLVVFHFFFHFKDTFLRIKTVTGPWKNLYYTTNESISRGIEEIYQKLQAMEKSVMVVGIDDSEHSFYSLEWILQHFFSSSPENSLFKLVIVHAKPSPASAIGLVGPGSADVLPYVVADLKKIAARVLEKAKEICKAKLVNDVILEIVEGDPRNVLCEAVEKYHASMLVVGSHGYGAIKRAVLGSVSDYCAHHAHCSVMIVKKPKAKH